MSGGDASEGVEARILGCALRHLRRDGLKRLTIVRVAEDAGMTHANVYRYFPSKIALLDRLCADWLLGIERRLGDISQAPDPADDKLERFLTFWARAMDEKALNEPHLFAVLTDAISQGRDMAARHQQRVRDLLLRVLEEGATTRVFTLPDVRRAEALTMDALHRFLDPFAIQNDLAGRRALTAGASSGEVAGAGAPAGGSGGARAARRDRLTRLVLRGLTAFR